MATNEGGIFMKRLKPRNRRKETVETRLRDLERRAKELEDFIDKAREELDAIQEERKELEKDIQKIDLKHLNKDLDDLR